MLRSYLTQIADSPAALVMVITYLVTYTMTIISINMIITLSGCAIALSIVTNLLATLLIAYKLWLVNFSFDVNDYSSAYS
jgi:hypothetical protein